MQKKKKKEQGERILMGNRIIYQEGHELLYSNITISPQNMLSSN